MGLKAETKLEMFWTLLLSRRLDERAWVLHRQGKIAFHISGIGHEAAQVGAAFALRRGYDWIAPYYRDLALMLAVGYTPAEFMLSLMGKKGEPNSGGRQMPSHWGLKRANVVSHSAPVATQCVHAAGIGLAIKLRKENKVVFTTLGEGSTSQGEWYEAVNWAAVHKLPVVFMVQNNMYAISEPTSKQMAVPSAADKACGLGLRGISVDGTNVFETYDVMQEAVDRARNGEGPSLIEARLYRITPHSSDDDDRSYRS
ncbi:MAG: thiamine pyrophosphate-dependent dehydrogenase E1 component subunit alpha, partial [Anaerolineaceae bacterium]|nr:thiamine pyrophosphate-dependent dehydrogenase E1 component subunit alpha [Anaerolineaceae bacterium]